MNKLKILYVVPYFAPAWSYGGTVSVSFSFAKELVRLGHNVTVATTDVFDAKSRNNKLIETIDGIKVFRFKNVNNTIARNFNFYTPLGFKRWLKQNILNYDVVHIHELFTYQSIVTSQLCRKHHKPYVIQPHGSLFRVASRSRFYLIKNLIIKRFTSLVLGSNAVIVLNGKERKGVTDILPQVVSKIKIVPNGLDLNEFDNIERIDLHRLYNIPRQNKIIAFIGRIKFIKGLDISLRALASIKNDIDFTFLIIGPDEGEKSNLEKIADRLEIRDRVIFTGLISGTKKLETLKSADLSLLLSRSEGQPTTLLESAALGLPIICSRESNLPEVEKYRAGFVVDNEQQAEEKIKLILNSAQMRRQFSQNALGLAESFNISKCAQMLINIYRLML